MSGFTATGATIVQDIEALPKSIILWRSLTHWLGGMGIIVLAVAILPLLGIGGVQLFSAEATGSWREINSTRESAILQNDFGISMLALQPWKRFYYLWQE